MNTLRAFVRRPCRATAHNLFFCRTKGIAHLIYFAAVFVESHGVYALAGGALFVFGVVGFIAGEGDE